MPIKSSGTPLSFSEIQEEFGPSKNTTAKLGEYRVSETYGSLSGIPLDSGMPQPPDPISFSDFYGKKLNMVVDFYSGSPSTRTRADGRRKYDFRPGDVKCVGGLRETRPSNPKNRKVILHINDTIQSQASALANGARTACAFRTGEWPDGTILQIDVGSSGRIYGAGGDGGSGADSDDENGSAGTNGNSGIGIQYDGTTQVNILSGAIVAAGGGGGGGGGAAYDNEDASKDGDDVEEAAGGGGGGGAGQPEGIGGNGGGGSGIADGSDGSDGGSSSGGNGGGGGSKDSEAFGGDGGDGGDLGNAGESGERGNGQDVSNGGGAGQAGWWIVYGGAGSVFVDIDGETFGGSNGSDRPA